MRAGAKPGVVQPAAAVVVAGETTTEEARDRVLRVLVALPPEDRGSLGAVEAPTGVSTNLPKVRPLEPGPAAPLERAFPVRAEADGDDAKPGGVDSWSKELRLLLQEDPLAATSGSQC